MKEFFLSLLSAGNLIIFILTLVVIYSVQTWLLQPKGMPPMPHWPLPLVGHVLSIKPNPVVAFMKWKEKLGSIFTVYLGSTPTIVISSYELLNDAFVKKAPLFSSRPPDFRESMWPDVSSGIIFNSGHSWKVQRTLSTTILKNFGMGKNWLAEKIVDEVSAFTDVLGSYKEEPRDLFNATNMAVSNVICAILLGERFEYTDPFFIHFINVNREFTKLSLSASPLIVFPWLRFIPGDLFGAKLFMKMALDLNQTFSDGFIKRFKDRADDESQDNYIKTYIREMKKQRDAGEDTDLNETNLRRCIDDLFLAGSETTSTTLLWSMVFAMNHPEVQKKIHQEIDDVVGTSRVPDLQDKSNLHYLNAFIMETQRVGSIAPLAALHECAETTELGGYTIPKGARIAPHLDGILKDKETWKDPEVFRPERFLDDNGHLVTPKYFLPFSAGKRACMGESLARMELFLFASAIYQRFEVVPESPGHPPSMEPVVGNTLAPSPFKVSMRERF